MLRKVFSIVLLLVITFTMLYCSSFKNIIMRKKWKLEEYEDYYFVVDEGNPVGYAKFHLDRYYNENNEQRYTETTERYIYQMKEDGTQNIIATKSVIKTDGDLNLLQFQFYSTPLYEGDKEKFNQGVIEDGVLKVLSQDNELMETEIKDKLPSILNYRYLIKNMDLVKGELVHHKFFSIKYLLLVKESIVYAGEESIKYKNDIILTDKFLLMPFDNTEDMDAYYFDKDGNLVYATIFQERMYLQWTTRLEIMERFKIG